MSMTLAVHLALECAVGLALLLGVAANAVFIVYLFGVEVRRAVEKRADWKGTDTVYSSAPTDPGSDICPA